METGEVGIDDDRERVDRRGGREFDDVELAPVRRGEPDAPARRGRAPCPPPPFRGWGQITDEASDAPSSVSMMRVTVGASR